MNTQILASAVWREALMIVFRHPVATIAPALLLGVLTESPHRLPDYRNLLEVVSAFLTESLAFYLYVAYAERLTSEARRSPEPIPLARVLRTCSSRRPSYRSSRSPPSPPSRSRPRRRACW